MSSRRTLALAMLVAIACVGCTPDGAIETETDTSSTMARTAPARVYEGPPVTLQAELSGIVRIDTGAGCVTVEVLGNPSQLADVIFPEGTTVDLSDPSDPVIEMSGMRLRDGAGVQLGGGSLDKARYPAGPDDPPWCDDDNRVFVLSGDGRTVEPEIVTTTPPTSGSSSEHEHAQLALDVSDTPSFGEGIEGVFVRNTGASPFDIGGWIVRSRNATRGFTFPAGTTIPPGSTVAVYENATFGDRCPSDTAKVFFACNEFGTTRTTRDFLFPSRRVQLMSPSGDVVTEGSP